MIAEKLRRLMKERGISQKELSEQAGVSQAFISHVLKGYKVPSVAVLKRIADYFETSADEFLKDDE